jgi:hypothetical protein
MYHGSIFTIYALLSRSKMRPCTRSSHDLTDTNFLQLGLREYEPVNETSLNVARSRIHGRGLFAKSNIPARRDLGAYTGLVREMDYQGTRAYCMWGTTRGRDVLFDAMDSSCVLRHINHGEAGQQNTIAREVFADGIPHLLTTRRITRGEELLLNYGKGYWEASSTRGASHTQ